MRTIITLIQEQFGQLETPAEVEVVKKKASDLAYIELFAEPDLTLLMEPGSALILSKEAFYDWCHGAKMKNVDLDLIAARCVGIEGRSCDVYPLNVANASLLHDSSMHLLGNSLERTKRVSIVLWQGKSNY